MSTKDKSTVFERIAAVVAWIHPQRQAQWKLPASDQDTDFHAASTLCYTVEAAGRVLKDLPGDAAINPLGALNSSRDFMRAIEIDLLLFRFERWMLGQCSAKDLVFNTYEYSKGLVLSGYEADLNCADPIQNVVNVYRNRAHCDIMKTINSAVKNLNVEREKEEKKVKAKA